MTALHKERTFKHGDEKNELHIRIFTLWAPMQHVPIGLSRFIRAHTYLARSVALLLRKLHLRSLAIT